MALDLELMEERPLGNGLVCLRYRQRSGSGAAEG
jgi:hypothetical protein